MKITNYDTAFGTRFSRSSFKQIHPTMLMCSDCLSAVAQTVGRPTCYCIGSITFFALIIFCCSLRNYIKINIKVVLFFEKVDNPNDGYNVIDTPEEIISINELDPESQKIVNMFMSVGVIRTQW